MINFHTDDAAWTQSLYKILMLLKALEGVITNVQFLMYNVNENVDTTTNSPYIIRIPVIQHAPGEGRVKR